MSEPVIPSAENVARRFHEVYEELAPAHGYKTREASAVPWEDVPAANKALMIEVAGVVVNEFLAEQRAKPHHCEPCRDNRCDDCDGDCACDCCAVHDAEQRAEKAEAALAEARDKEYRPFGKLDPANPIDQAIVAAFNRLAPRPRCSICDYGPETDHHKYPSAKGFHPFAAPAPGEPRGEGA